MSSRLRRARDQAWLGLALLMLLGFMGCGERDSQPAAKRIEPPELALFALGYQPGAHAREALIKDAQAHVRAHPEQADGYVALAEAFLTRMQETGDSILIGYAKDALAAARTLEPDHVAARRAYIMVLFEGHRFAEAAEEARRLIAADAGDTTAHMLLSDALLELGDYQGSVEALQAAMDRFPDLRVHARTGYLRWLHGDVEGALESLSDALMTGSVQPAATAFCYVEIGIIDWHRGKLDSADAAAQRALALVADYLPALALAARVAFVRGDTARAIDLLERVVERRPNAEQYLQLAEWTRAGDADKSREHRARAEKLAGYDPLALAHYNARHGIDSERALQLAERALAERSSIYAHATHALALMRAGRHEQAQAASDRALVLATPDARLYLERALIDAARGDWDAADKARQQALGLDPLIDRVDPVVSAQWAERLAARTPTTGAGAKP